MSGGVNRFTNLRAWQACETYKNAVYKLCDEAPTGVQGWTDLRSPHWKKSPGYWNTFSLLRRSEMRVGPANDASQHAVSAEH